MRSNELLYTDSAQIYTELAGAIAGEDELGVEVSYNKAGYVCKVTIAKEGGGVLVKEHFTSWVFIGGFGRPVRMEKERVERFMGEILRCYGKMPKQTAKRYSPTVTSNPQGNKAEALLDMF